MNSSSSNDAVAGDSSGSASARGDSLGLFLLLPAVAMSLGWGLRGTIGGGPVGAMIPGAMVTLALCHLLGWNRQVGIVAAIGTVGVGLGGQETYGQTIGFLKNPETVLWGLTGLTIKGAMWGLSGGVLIGLAFTQAKYKCYELGIGLALMMAGTTLGRLLVDEPKLAYFSNRLDQPREEVWVGVTLGGSLLWAWLFALRRERVSTLFAAGGLLAGAAGFGGGSLFLALGNSLPPPYRGWPWWKMMEFTFGALYGLGLGGICFVLRQTLRDAETQTSGDQARRDILGTASAMTLFVCGWIVAVGGLWLNFTIPYRAPFTLVASLLILVSIWSNRLAWHVALSMTVCGFVRDFLRGSVERYGFEPGWDGWLIVAAVSLPVVAVVARTEANGRLTPAGALLGLARLATAFGLIKVGIPLHGKGSGLFVLAVFVLELLATIALVQLVSRREERVKELEG